MTSLWTFALQIVNFLALVWLLHRFLYRPVQKTIAERQRRSEDAAARVTAAQRAADEARAAVEGERQRAATEGAHVLEQARAKAEAERNELLDKARETADEVVTAGRRTLDEERAHALAALEGQAGELATAIAQRVLSELGSVEIDDALLGRLDAYLGTLPADRLRALAAEATSGVEVVTAHDLEPRTAARWRERLGARLGGTTPLSFRTDSTLLGGAELHFRTSIVRSSWRDALGRAEEALRSHAVAS